MYKKGNEKYEGEWVDGERQGFGVMVYQTGDVYEGEWF